MAHEDKGQGTGALRGFAGMEQEKQREIARKGGANVPTRQAQLRAGSSLASEAGRKGGRAVAPQHRSFAQNRALAAAAGRKGGQTSQSRRSRQDRPAEQYPVKARGTSESGNYRSAEASRSERQREALQAWPLGVAFARHQIVWRLTMISAVSFAAEAKANPTRYYRRPSEVVRDRRLNRDEKLAILEAWELEARELAVAAEENMSGGEPSLLQDVVQARIELGDMTDPTDDDGAPTKQGVRKAQADRSAWTAQRLGANGFSPLRSLKRMGTPGRSKARAGCW